MVAFASVDDISPDGIAVLDTTDEKDVEGALTLQAKKVPQGRHGYCTYCTCTVCTLRLLGVLRVL